MFNTHSLAFTHTHKCSGSVQYSLTGIHIHSQAFRECSVLTQMRTFSWSHHVELHTIMTQRWSCALNGCSHSLNDIHVHTLGVQGVFNTHSLAFMHTKWVFRGCSAHSLAFMCTQWVFRGCSPSLIGGHLHSQLFRKCSICIQLVHVPEGPMNMFSNLQSAQRSY